MTLNQELADGYLNLLGQNAGLREQLAAARKEDEENDALREKMSGILHRIALAVHGDPPELTRWSWHDLPELVADLVKDNKLLRAHIQVASDWHGELSVFAAQADDSRMASMALYCRDLHLAALKEHKHVD